MKVRVGEDDYNFKLQLMQLEITGICNMFCKHCRAENEPRVHMPFDTFKRAIDFAISESNEELRVTLSGGEPFLHPELIKFLEYLSEKKIRNVAITTNGSVHDLAVLGKIKELNMPNLFIQVSIDSPNRDEHNEFRNHPGAFEKAMDFFELMKSHGIQYSIRSTFSRDRLHYMEPMVQLAITKNAHRMSFGTIVPAGRGKSFLFSQADKKIFIEEYARLKDKYPKIDIVTEDPLKILMDKESIARFINSKTPFFGGCSAGVLSLNIGSDGTMTPCSLFTDPIVNITNKSTDEIKQAYENSEIIKKLVKRNFGGKCSSCKLIHVCGGCRAIPNALDNNYCGEDPTCWINPNELTCDLNPRK